ncbi:hypothetical protein Q8F55_007289 [Vanrija albida]|uniref:EXPERA domain-containing protein n=1 Tax=Vanrija albida TaxID=181172 RepID=A0ABR3Q0E5_9TREE
MPPPFTLAAIALTVYTTAHTFFGTLFPSSFGPEADAVFLAMKTTTFDLMGSESTYYKQWFGLGIYTSLFLIFSAYIAVALNAAKTGEQWAVLRPIAVALAAAHVADAGIAFAYFFISPVIMSSLTVLLVVWGIKQKDDQFKKKA